RHPEHEPGPAPDQLPRQREDLLDLTGGEQRPACVDPADQRDINGLRPDGMAADLFRAGALLTNRGKMDLHRARPAEVAVQITLPLQDGELVRNARRAD